MMLPLLLAIQQLPATPEPLPGSPLAPPAASPADQARLSAYALVLRREGMSEAGIRTMVAAERDLLGRETTLAEAIDAANAQVSDAGHRRPLDIAGIRGALMLRDQLNGERMTGRTQSLVERLELLSPADQLVAAGQLGSHPTRRSAARP